MLHRIAFTLLVSAGALLTSTCHAQVEWTVSSPDGKKPAIKVVSETFFRFRYTPGSYKPKALSARVFLTNGTIVGDTDGFSFGYGGEGMGAAMGGGAGGMGGPGGGMGMGMGGPGGGMGMGGGEGEGGMGESEPAGLELFALVVKAKNAEGENATNVQVIFNKDAALFGYPGYGMGGMGAGMGYGGEEGGYGGFSGGGGYGEGGGDGGYPGSAGGGGGAGDGFGSGFGAARPGDGKRKALGEYYELESLLQPKVAKRTLGSRYKLEKQELKIVKDFIQLAGLRNVLLEEIKDKKNDADFLAGAEKKLKQILSNQYTNQLARQKIEIEAIESKVEKLRSELDRREAAKDRVVDVQVGRIILEAQGLLDN